MAVAASGGRIPTGVHGERTGALRNAIARAIGLIAAATLLGGCMMSGAPLFSPDKGSDLIPAGEFVLHKRAGDGAFHREALVSLLRNGSQYDVIDEEGAGVPLTLHPLDEHTLLAQLADVQGRYGYALVVRDGDDFLIHIPDCAHQGPARLAAAGAKIETLTCVIESVADAKVFFLGLDRGPAIARLVRSVPLKPLLPPP